MFCLAALASRPAVAQSAVDTNLQVSITRLGQSTVLGWFGSNLMAYQAEVSTNLAVWSRLGPVLPGSGGMLFATNPVSGSGYEFFRVWRMVDTTSAVFNPQTGVLTITGNELPNTIVVSRDGTGVLRVNGGALAIAGGTPTVANTTLIQIFGRDADDVLSLDEANGALPKANIFGEGGKDRITGGSGADILNGGSGDDTLIGQGGADTLLGGADNDTLIGGDGDDQVFGEGGNDRIVWNPGDDTDLNEGGDGTDTVEVNGGNGAEGFTITANGTRVRFDRINPAPFALDIGTCEELVLNANGGNDTLSCTGNLAPLIAITADGGPGDDTLLGSNGADILIGGDNNDFIDGQQGNDVIFLGAGDDVCQWDPGDGNDTIEGQAGADTLVFNGSNIGEIVDLSPNGARLRFARNVGSVLLDVGGIENVNFNALGGADVITIGDLAQSEVEAVNLRLASAIGGSTGDLQVDSVIINGSGSNDTVSATQSGLDVNILGLKPAIAVFTGETNDLITINTLAGDDTVDLSGVSSVFVFTVDGGPGDDTILGSSRPDFLFGGDHNDTLTGRQGDDHLDGGNGDDTFVWNPGDGSDVLEGQAGADTLVFNASNVSESIDLAPNGNRLRLFRNIGNVTMDGNGLESVRVNALGGSDSITVGEFSGTDVKEVLVDLATPASSGTGDAQPDTVTLNGTQTNDVIAVSGSTSSVTVTGLSAALRIVGMEATNDTLTVNALGGDDRVDASALDAGVIRTAINGGLGVDTLIGSAGNDVIAGGDGNDIVLAGAGDDTVVWNPGDDNDTVEGQAGFDTLLFNGANVAENIDISANGGRLRFFRNIASVVMDCNEVEMVQYQALGGADVITVNNLSGTDVTAVSINLAATGGGGDAAADSIIISGTSGDDVVNVAQSGGVITATGLPAAVSITGSEAANDRFFINTLAGDDVMDASALAAGFILLTADGGTDADVLIGSGGPDTLLGGEGDDVLLGGPGLDVLDGGPGSNIVIQD